MPAASVVTRFAPSPTGYLHIGGARTALFNFLFARHTGGTFLLRIEDTDRERSTDAAVRVILDGLAWLGLHADAEPVFQQARAERHREAAQALLAAGRAYRCFMSVEELEAERAKARAEGRAVRSPWRDCAPAEDGRPFVVRFRSPDDGLTTIDDLVQGPVTFKNHELDDLVILRSDGAPTYNLAVVVDDHDMGVTHVIRGDDHLNNTARQALIYQAMDWPLPAFAHIPLIHGPDGAKLSKRHGAQAVGDFEVMGYLPEALRNYLARLGWSHGDAEIFTDAEAVAWFDIKDVNKGAARLDWDKLNFINAHYIREADAARLAGLIAEVHERREVALSHDARARLDGAADLLRDRGKTIVELADQTLFLVKARPLDLDAKTQGLLADDEAAQRLARLRAALEASTAWAPAELESLVKDFAESEGVGLGKIGPVLRGVLAGGAPAPDLGRTLSTLGRKEALGRIDDALSTAASRFIRQAT
jgi:glutamyl-tRNA synthetase